jgi:hypothetical protein
MNRSLAVQPESIILLRGRLLDQNIRCSPHAARSKVCCLARHVWSSLPHSPLLICISTDEEVNCTGVTMEPVKKPWSEYDYPSLLIHFGSSLHGLLDSSHPNNQRETHICRGIRNKKLLSGTSLECFNKNCDTSKNWKQFCDPLLCVISTGTDS